MRYNLSREEKDRLKEQEHHLPKRAQNLTRSSLRVPGSQWGKEHLKSFRVLYLDNLPISRFFNENRIPTDNDKGRYSDIS